jgi:protein gp37
MGYTTKIEWTEASWIPIKAKYGNFVGWHCVKVSDGCRHCYAEILNRRRGTTLDYNVMDGKIVETFLDDGTLRKPLTWRAPRRIFVCSMTDLFGEWVSDEWIDRVFGIMALTSRHQYQVLTKRPERMRDYMRTERRQEMIEAVMSHESRAFGILGMTGWPLPNVWLGVSVENQRTADERIPILLDTPAAIRFISVEPLLEQIDLSERLSWSGSTGYPDYEATDDGPRINWVIVGGESGRDARPMNPDWVRAIRDECLAVEVPFFFKQWGEHLPVETYDIGGARRITYRKIGKQAASAMLDGRYHSDYPVGVGAKL